MADERYQVHTLMAAALLAAACWVLCGLSLAGLPVPPWLGWVATALTNGVVAYEKCGLLRRGKP